MIELNRDALDDLAIDIALLLIGEDWRPRYCPEGVHEGARAFVLGLGADAVLAEKTADYIVMQVNTLLTLASNANRAYRLHFSQ